MMVKKRSHGEGTIYFSNTHDMWVAQITLPDGKRKTKYSKEQKIVRDWLLVQRNQLKEGLLLEDDKILVSQFLDRYYNDVCQYTLRPQTLEAYEVIIRLHIKPEIGNIRLSQLRPDHIQKLYSTKLNQGLSSRTVQFIHSVLHKALKHALKWGLVTRNVSDLVDAPSPSRKKFNIWNAEQVKKFLQSVRDDRLYPLYVLAVTTGMREGELLGLYWEDVDLERGVIHVQHAIQQLPHKGLVITEPKTEKARRAITLPDFALSAMKEHHIKSGGGLVFQTGNKTPFSPRNIVRHFKAVIDKAGLPEIRFHDLRHTSATLLLTAGVHPKVVQERLGHSQINLTLDTYSHVLPVMQQDAANKLDEVLRI